jgi:hypothetical protein
MYRDDELWIKLRMLINSLDGMRKKNITIPIKMWT